jgi:hypothetical protein
MGQITRTDTPNEGDATTWPAVVSRALDAVCESWANLIRVCVFVLCIAAAVVAFWLASRIEAQFIALRYFTLDGTDRASHKEQARMIRRYIIWRNSHAYDERLRRVVTRANLACGGSSVQRLKFGRYILPVS